MSEEIGGFGHLSPEAVEEITNLVDKLSECVEFTSGETAFFWGLVSHINSTTIRKDSKQNEYV